MGWITFFVNIKYIYFTYAVINKKKSYLSDFMKNVPSFGDLFALNAAFRKYPTVLEGSTDPAEFRDSASEESACTRVDTFTRRLQLHREHPCTDGVRNKSLRAFLHRTLSRGTDTEWSRVPPSPVDSEARTQTLLAPEDPRLRHRVHRGGMSSSPEESRSRGGGSDRDSKKASSSSSSLDGGPPPQHQNRIRQVGPWPGSVRGGAELQQVVN